MAGQSVKKLIYFVVTVLLFSVLFLGKNTFQGGDLIPIRVEHDQTIPPVSPSSTTLGHRPSTPTGVSAPAATQEPVVFSLIMWSRSSAIEGALLIKTIIMYNTRPTDIHIICDDEAEEIIRSRMQLLTRPGHQIRVYYYKPTRQGMLDRVEREGNLKTDHSAGLPGLMKLFIHELLPTNVTKSIFVDTDAMFIVDPTLLWNVFDTLKPTTAIVMSSHPDENTPEWNNASRICSCVMLLDLQKLRESRLMNSEVYKQVDPNDDVTALGTSAFRAMYGEPKGENGRYDNVRLGDQGYWWAIVDYHKDIFEPLSYDFEVTSCLMNSYRTGLGSDTATEEEEGKFQTGIHNSAQKGVPVLPKLLHFNCLHGTDIYMDWPGWDDPNEYLSTHWASAMKYHNGYKWIWLNHGDREKPKHTVEQYTIEKAPFADQLLLKSYRHTHKNQH